MKKVLQILLLLISLIFASLLSGVSWNYMIYLDADNNLNYYGLDDLAEALKAEKSTNLRLMILLDRYEYGDSLIVTRCGQTTMTLMVSVISSNYTDEVNMGDGKTLENFIKWGMSGSNSADYTVHDLWNHGNG